MLKRKSVMVTPEGRLKPGVDYRNLQRTHDDLILSSGFLVSQNNHEFNKFGEGWLAQTSRLIRSAEKRANFDVTGGTTVASGRLSRISVAEPR